MTTTVTTASTGPVIANGTTPIPFTFQSLSTAEIQVERAGVVVSPSTYAVQRNADGTGTITPLTSWGSDTVTIYSDPDLKQLTQFDRHGAFYPDQMNGPLDRLARSMIGLRDKLIKQIAAIPKGDAGPPGANVMSIGLFSAASALSIPSGTETVRTGGYAAKGVGIADYVSDAGVDSAYVAANPRTSFISTNGRGFRLSTDQTLTAERFGAVGDGITDDRAALAAAAALGRVVELKDGASYLISSRISGVTGTRFVSQGRSTIIFKTGAGGYNSTSLTADKSDATMCGFLFSGVDDIGMKGIRFTTDGVAPRVIYPIRVLGGTATKGCQFDDLEFVGFAILNGGFLSLNSIGAGSYVVTNIRARDCGTALTSWTGNPQVTVVEIDNDLIGGLHSTPGVLRNIRGTNVLLSGAALTAYGQQTDVLNIAGASSTARKGPEVDGVYGDGVGEVLDLFCSYANAKNVRGRNCRVVAKLVHGASYNNIEAASESCSDAVVEIAGSTVVGVGDTAYNTVRVTAAAGVGEVGTTSGVPVVLFQENGGTTGKAKNNLVIVDAAVAGAGLDFWVKDNHTNTGNNNLVIFHKTTGTPATSIAEVTQPSNSRIQMPASGVKLTMSAPQTLTTAVPATVQFNTVVLDRQGEAVTASFKINAKSPGVKRIFAQLRASLDANVRVQVDILRNGASVATSQYVCPNGSDNYTYSVDGIFEVLPNEAGTTLADFSIQATLTGTGTLQIGNAAIGTVFEMIDVAR